MSTQASSTVGEALPPVSTEMPDDLRVLEEAFEDSLYEAAACGDAGFVDRVFTCWWADTGTDTEIAAAGVPADPADVLGAVGWLGLASRERNQSDARFLAAVHVVGHHDGTRDDDGRPVRDPYAVDELAAAQGWSASMAGSWLSLAEAVIDRLPRVHEAMSAGRLDLGKARTIVEETRAMPADLAGMVTARVLPGAGRVSHSELALRIGTIASGLDADWATRRTQAAQARVRLEATRNPEGTADLALRDLDAEWAQRARARIDALAVEVQRAARATGCRAPLGLVRALIAGRLWDGSYVGHDDDTLIARLADELPGWLAELHSDGEARDEPTGGEPTGGEPTGGEPTGDEPTGGAEPTGDVRVGTVELRMRLSTALGLDDLPGELIGQGALPARDARRMLRRTREGRVATQCRLVMVDAEGHPEHVVLVPLEPSGTRRPCPRDRTGRRGSSRGQVIVELAAATTTLHGLDPDDHPAWAPWLRRAQHRVVGLVGLVGLVDLGAQHPATSTADAHRRAPGRALERWIRSRDGRCIGVTCTGAAYCAEIDHTHEWAADGRTVATNLGLLCEHCHRLKHDGGWRLSQPEPGRFSWHSRLGATYTVEPRRVLDPPPDPAPRTDHGPRRVVLHRRAPRADRDGWIRVDHRRSVPAQVPAAPRRPGRATPRRDRDDEPPPPF